MAPILIFMFHYQARFAIGSDLAYAAVAKFFGAWKHRSAGTVNLRLVWPLAAGSVPASLVGVWVLHLVSRHNAVEADRLLKILLGVVLCVVSLTMMARSIPRVEEWLQTRQAADRPHQMRWAVLAGVVGGFLVGLTSVGAGTLFAVALLLIFGLDARELVGTDIFHAAILSAVAALAHVWAQDVDYPLVASLLAGAIPGVLLGSHLSTRMPEKALRPTLAAVLFATAIRSFG
jgi:uncharacterized membrane protein YfcA